MATLDDQVRGLQLSLVTRTSRKDPIGSGVYGSVFEVMVNQTVCAAKIYLAECNPTAKSHFLSECVRCSKFLHPNVVQFLGIYYPNPEVNSPWFSDGNDAYHFNEGNRKVPAAEYRFPLPF